MNKIEYYVRDTRAFLSEFDIRAICECCPFINYGRESQCNSCHSECCNEAINNMLENLIKKNECGVLNRLFAIKAIGIKEKEQ